MRNCQYCRASLTEAANFCGVCGKSLGSDTPIPPVQQDSNSSLANLDNTPTQRLFATNGILLGLPSIPPAPPDVVEKHDGQYDSPDSNGHEIQDDALALSLEKIANFIPSSGSSLEGLRQS